MLRLALFIAITTTAFIAPCHAQDPMQCNDASMRKMQVQMNAMTTPAMKKKKEMARKEMKMAKTSMAKHNMSDCQMHLMNAQKMMKS